MFVEAQLPRTLNTHDEFMAWRAELKAQLPVGWYLWIAYLPRFYWVEEPPEPGAKPISRSYMEPIEVETLRQWTNEGEPYIYMVPTVRYLRKEARQ